MTSQGPGVVVRAADNPHPEPRADNGERAFADHLDRLGWKYEWEPVTFYGLPPITKGGSERAFTPDVKLVSIPNRPLDEAVYLELTEADRFISPADLPEAILRKNIKFSSSKKPFISPAEYLARKSAKISHAVRIHRIRVVLLSYALQRDIFEDPEILLELVNQAAQADPARLRLVS
jgi:hypothetical protein